MTTAIDLDTLQLAKGSHDTCADGMCLYEAYNMLAFERHTDDRPVDVSPVLYTYGIQLNDVLPDDKRQQLKVYLPRDGQPSPLSGTYGDGLDETRSYMALDWLIRTYTPAWLDLAGLSAEAQQLRDLRRIVDLVAAQQAGPVVREARIKAAAARDAADAARDAARAAGARAAGARDAARDAADAAWAAAWAARDAADAADAAWAARAAACAARDAACAAWAAACAAWAAAWAARDAADAASDAASDAAWDAAWAAAWAALSPTVDALRDSAIALFESMVRPS